MSPTYRLLGLLSVAMLLCPLYADEAPAEDWHSIDAAVVERLLAEPLGDVLEQLAEHAESRDAPTLLTRLSVLVRAGHREAALAVVDRLVGSTGLPERFELSQAGDFLIGREEWDLARRFLERFPSAEPGWGYVFIKRWAADGDPRAIDRWLARQAEANEAYWFAERLRFRKSLGTEAELLQALVAEVRKHPARLAPAERYLRAVDGFGNAVQLDWMGEVCRPRLAYESYRLGRALARRWPAAAVPLLERSLATEFTEHDRKMIDEQMRLSMSALLDLRDWERELRLWTKHALAECYQATGDSDRAQPLVEELADAGPHSLPPPALGQLAGTVQAGSGARVIENRIREAETEQGESSDYWLTRAAYYSGRGEHDETVRAYERALALEPLDPRRPESSGAARQHVLGRYLHYVGRHSGEAAAVRLTRRELEATPVAEPYTAHLIRHLLELDDDVTGFIDPADDLFWTYLDSRDRWEHTEERLLATMVRNAEAEMLPKLWQKAEALAAHADPTRSRTLGWIMTRSNAVARSLPLLHDAVRRMPPGPEAASARFTLFEAYLDLDDWEAAEGIWPVVRQRLGPREVAEWLGRIAVAAARSGAADEAMRLWAAVSNIDRAELRYLDEFSRCGLSGRLRAFYSRLSEDDPSCWVPGVVLERLSEP